MLLYNDQEHFIALGTVKAFYYSNAFVQGWGYC